MLNDRELPLGIQDFEKLRKIGCLYVDKTQYVYQLTRKHWPYFLGKKDIFEGLAIAGLEKEWIEYPVFRRAHAQTGRKVNLVPKLED